MFRRLLAATLLIGLVGATLAGTARAATVNNKGLLISPVKEYAGVDAGHQKTGNFTVANLMSAPITVNLILKQFSVSDYTYNFHFEEPGNKWVSLGTSSVLLKPNENKKIGYTINVPSRGAPGGYYYTFIASADLTTAGLVGTVQAGTLLYLTVNGKLIQTSTTVRSSIAHFVYQTSIPYTIDVKNTGNVHYFAYFSGHLTGLFTDHGTTGTSHLLLPDTIRRVGGTIPAPLLPGIYRAHYGYKTDSGAVFMQSSYVVYLPPWSAAGLLLISFILYKFYSRRRTPNES